jgi:hypothetical protein
MFVKRNVNCQHIDTVGVCTLFGKEIGLCTNCERVIILSEGKKADKKLALEWIKTHLIEARNFNLWRVYR